jgi:S-adenosylmethionine:tRNA ribosyltransferase-isomerase
MDPGFQLETYDYPLDKRLIAQIPLPKRDEARLMVLRRATGLREHRHFQDVVQYLRADDLLVLNDTRVIPARLAARKVPTGGRVEVLLLRRSSAPPPKGFDRWEALIQGSTAAGQLLQVSSELEIKILERFPDGRWLVDLLHEGELFPLLDRLGIPPLPPYIRRAPQDADRKEYQTVYARPYSALQRSEGSVAAPTAGLHFTEALLEKVRAQGVRTAFITLHIGLGTFRPVRVTDIRRHSMDPEYYEISAEAARRIEETQRKRGRIIAVGTSATRALETAMIGGGWSGTTGLFIYPGYRFKAISGLITNFHLPKSTLLMLVSAFAGVEVLKEAYAEAARMRYRFLSFGDAMLIL